MVCQSASIKELHRSLTPLVVPMKVLGFMFDNRPREMTADTSDSSQDTEQDKGPPTPDRKYRVVNKLVCLCVCCLLWLRTLSYVPSFWVGVDFSPDMTSTRVVFLLWLFQCSLNVSITLYGSLKNNSFTSFLELWKTLKIKEESEELPEDEESSSGATTSYANIAFAFCDSNEIRKRGKHAWITTNKVSGLPSKDRTSDSPDRDNQPTTTTDFVSHISDEQTDEIHHTSSNSCQGEEDKTRLSISQPTPVDTSDQSSRSHKMKENENVVSEDGEIEPSSKRHRANDIESDSSNTTTFARSSHRRRHRPKSCFNKYDKIGIKYAIIGWCFILFNIALSGFYLFHRGLQEFTYMAAGMTGPFGSSLPVRIAGFVIQILDSCAWILPTAFCCAVCAVLRTRFNHLTTTITTQLAQSQDCFPAGLECWRQEHLRLCQCVTVLDRTMGKLLMASYVTCLPVSVFLLYMLVGTGLGLPNKIIFAFWFFSEFAYMMLVSVVAASVYDAAHSSLDRLFFVRADQATPIQLAQLQLFLSKLSGSPIGFTAVGITITREMVLTLVGLLMTYFLVLLPLQIS